MISESRRVPVGRYVEMSMLDDADAEPQKEVPHFIDCLRDGRWALRRCVAI